MVKKSDGKNFKNVDVIGQTTSSYPSSFTNFRQNGVKNDNFVISEKDGKAIFKRTYQVGGIKWQDAIFKKGKMK